MVKQQLLETLNKAFKCKSWQRLRDQLCDYVLKNQEVFEQASAHSGAHSVGQCVEWMRDDSLCDKGALDDVFILAAACHFDTRIQIAMPKGRVFVEEPPSNVRLHRTLHVRWEPFEYSLAPMYDLRVSI